MYNFFVLGQIPGTSITITFTMWLQAGLFIALLIVLFLVHRHHELQDNLLGATISNDSHGLQPLSEQIPQAS